MLDTNENAGVSVLFDTPTAGTTPVTYSTNTPVTIGSLTTANSVVDSPITVADNYVETGTGIAVQLNIAYRNDPDLTATLIAPDGTTMILLFANVGNTGSKANFTNTVLQDSTTSGGITVANSSITTGAPPFTGRFAPQTPLDSLGAIPVQGTWTLEIADSATGTTGTLLNWSLTFLKPLTSTGLGEPVADQATVSFRIFTMNPSNPLSRNTWTAVGPASIDSNGQAGVIERPCRRSLGPLRKHGVHRRCQRRRLEDHGLLDDESGRPHLDTSHQLWPGLCHQYRLDRDLRAQQ